MLTTIKRSGIGAVAAALVVSVAGCSDYPDTGLIDTKMLRSEAAIIEVEGNVYGLKTGSVDAFSALKHDRDLIREAPYYSWIARQKGEQPPYIELQYKESDLDSARLKTAIDEIIANAESELDKQVAEALAEAQSKRDQLAAKLEEVSQGGTKFDAYVAEAKAAYEASEKALENARVAYNQAIERPVKKINELAAANGLDKVGDYQNPLRSYRTIDLRNRKMPSSCPAQRGYTTVDLRNEQKQCAYIRIPSGFDQFAAEIAAATKDSMINIPKLKEQLGKERSWGSKASGAYAARDNAKDTYETKVAEAQNKYGNKRQRDYQKRRLNAQLERANSELARVQTDEYRIEQAEMIPLQYPENYTEALDQHVSAAFETVKGHIEKGPVVTLGEKDAEFQGLESGYEGAVAIADFIIEDRGRRENVTSIHYIDLTNEAVTNADELSVELTRDSLRDARYIDVRDQEDIDEAIFEILHDAAKARAKAEKA